MRIATWNVNSIRSRIDRVTAWLERNEVDAIAIQETKAREDQFPFDRFAALGYEVAHHGLNQWNGVAIASRVGLSDVQVGFDAMPGWGEPIAAEARAIGAVCRGVRLWSLYIPNGRSLDDPHLTYKLQWLDALAGAARGWLADDPAAQIALLGDWNIAPNDADVWSVPYYEDKTHTSPAERAAFDAVVDAGFSDVVRPHTSEPGTFTYWDYTRLSFQKRRGMRIDFILGSPAFAGRVLGAAIDREERKGKGASDHAPVVVEIAD